MDSDLVGRLPDRLRRVTITLDYLCHAEGSSLIELGDTRVISSVTVEQSLPPFLGGVGQGWVRGEYAMLPRATEMRTAREWAREGWGEGPTRSSVSSVTACGR